MGKYSEYDRASLSFAWRLALWTLAGIVFCGLLGWLILGIRAATSETKGELDKTIAINQGKNQIQSQELFEDLYAKIQEYDKNLDQAAADKKANPGSSFHTTNYSGLVMACNEAVTQYNAEARKVSRGKWMSADLPYEIDTTDTRFDCKESAR